MTTTNAGSFTIPIQLATGTNGSAIAFESTDVPKAIPDSNFAGVDSSVTVANVTGLVGKVTLSLYLTHTFDSDLQASLIAPDGTEVQLFASVGGSGENFGSSSADRTVLDDDAATSIAQGTAPFVGTFRPQGALSTLRGKAANGIWKLRIKDVVVQDTGTLRNWALSITPLTCTDGGGACDTNVAPVVDLNGPADWHRFQCQFQRRRWPGFDCR